ncbi:E2F-associated phosphoprotein isoform X1 [Xyrichtys novacula]|uniref:E2F-associated phosphoprotein isoform X1 n=1 Tax=Xyrichtys novacula TaxID=13765 RepID=A0AAV1GMR6_XYRNO|nr:E2F-associated phosphoprotein isoform X1 [Xyrichtys novacula]
MNKLNKTLEFDSYEIEEPSDEERAESSSEDELDVLLNGTPEQKKKLIREYLTGESESSSGDEFEKEMEAELSSTIKTMEGTWGPSSTAGNSGDHGGGGGGGGGGGPRLPDRQMYDEIYFDSDSEEEENTPSSSTGRRRKQRTVLTNDELLYDPDEDDRDQAWVDARRRGYNRKRTPAGSRLQPQGLPSSDAVLNCPACMTTLCLDCQRHESYRTQYRAMFVMNCTVKKDEVLRYKTQPDRKQRNRKRRRGQKTETPRDEGADETPTPAPAGMDSDEVYHPVQCSECSTEVAVFDKDEVFHFFNILASHC